MPQLTDLTIIGAGAAGLFCALEAGRRGRTVTLIERNAQPGRKIIISGGGRCNFTNVHVTAENFISQNPHFCKSALARYTPADFLALVKKHRIPFYEKTLGQLFCRGSSHSIVEMLLKECKSAGVRLVTDCGVKAVSKDRRFIIETTRGRFESSSLVIATGGLSFPKVGATGFGYEIAKQFGLKVLPTRPSLVPLRFANANFSKLSGLAVDSVAKAAGQNFRENILFTHKGLSGPAVLQASNYWEPGGEVSFDLVPDTDLPVLFESNRDQKMNIRNFVSGLIPQRLVDELLPDEIANTPLFKADEQKIEAVVSLLEDWRVRFRETEGWHKAEVTLGGVDTNELSSKTLESKRVEKLYFIGEVLDVTGWLGGYNFQWAWSSGFACAQAV